MVWLPYRNNSNKMKKLLLFRCWYICVLHGNDKLIKFVFSIKNIKSFIILNDWTHSIIPIYFALQRNLLPRQANFCNKFVATKDVSWKLMGWIKFGNTKIWDEYVKGYCEPIKLNVFCESNFYSMQNSHEFLGKLKNFF